MGERRRGLQSGGVVKVQISLEPKQLRDMAAKVEELLQEKKEGEVVILIEGRIGGNINRTVQATDVRLGWAPK